MTARLALLERLADEVVALCDDRVVFVGIDGVDGAGKTTFADELGASIRSVPVIRASVDGFHNPRAVRYRRGRQSPEGYYLDSFDYALLSELLLDPLAPGGSLRYRTAAFDHRTDRPVASPELRAELPSVLVFDGIFLHRPELARYWDYSLFLEVSPPESLRRCIAREGVSGIPSDPTDPVHRRYVRGQQLYLERCRPRALATRVVHNEDLANPWVDDARAPARSAL